MDYTLIITYFDGSQTEMHAINLQDIANQMQTIMNEQMDREVDAGTVQFKVLDNTYPIRHGD